MPSLYQRSGAAGTRPDPDHVPQDVEVVLRGMVDAERPEALLEIRHVLDLRTRRRQDRVPVVPLRNALAGIDRVDARLHRLAQTPETVPGVALPGLRDLRAQAVHVEGAQTGGVRHRPDASGRHTG